MASQIINAILRHSINLGCFFYAYKCHVLHFSNTFIDNTTHIHD